MMRCAALILIVWGAAQGSATAESPDFSRDIQPLLAKRCLSCHGPDTQEAGLRLDDRAAATKQLDSGSHAIVAGQSTTSELLARITSTDPDTQMPPEGPRLTPAEIAALAAWIDNGAEWKGHWAFQPLSRPGVPAVEGIEHSIDAFIRAGLTHRGLAAPPEADRAALLRRATYDVTGLPPSEQEMREFLADESPTAWERVVDRLLASPHYGEKWARHWLDLVRYADTNSFERDGDKPHAWRYRDYVIRSLNNDKPYDQFVVEQLAGDELPAPTADSLIATGYYRLGLWDDEPADRLQAKYDGLDDIVATTAQTFLGLTINCARCHDHKIDPLPQRDYYGLLAFFHNITPMGERQMNPKFIERAIPLDGESADEAQHRGEELARRREEARRNVQEIEKRIKEHGEQALDDLTKADLANWKARLAALDRENAAVSKALVVSEHGPAAPDTFVFYRGNPHAEPTPENRVEPSFPGVLNPRAPVIPTPSADAKTTGRRTALAGWIASPDNPLTARVMVNRIWQHHFGRGLVRSPSNFGLAGDPPTHPELLDWLAAEFIAGGWRLKPLHKLILMSEAYRASSAGNAEALAKDPLNDALWRFDMRRLSAEEIRDSIHVASGAFNPKMFGPGVFPDIPDEVKATQSRPGAGWGNSPPEEQARRSIYAKVKRSLLVPILSDYDVADTDTTCPVRFVTTQPTQALGMMNGSFLHAQARVFAGRVQREAGGPDDADVTAMVRRAIEIALVRPATDKEVAAGVAVIDQLEDADGVSPSRAFELYCLMLLNLNEFAYLD
jgi:mono/diheme cytochrome c family protein